MLTGQGARFQVLIRIHDSALASEPPLAEPPSPNRAGRTGRTVPGGDSAEPPEPPVKYTAAGLGLVTRFTPL